MMTCKLASMESNNDKHLLVHQCVVETNILLEIVTPNGSTEIKVSKTNLRKALELL